MADSAKSGMQDKMVAIGWIGLAASFHFAAYEFARGSTIVLYTTQFGSAAMSYALTGNPSLACCTCNSQFFITPLHTATSHDALSVLPVVSVALIMIYNYILELCGPAGTLLWSTLLIAVIFGLTALSVDIFKATHSR